MTMHTGYSAPEHMSECTHVTWTCFIFARRTNYLSLSANKPFKGRHLRCFHELLSHICSLPPLRCTLTSSYRTHFGKGDPFLLPLLQCTLCDSIVAHLRIVASALPRPGRRHIPQSGRTFLYSDVLPSHSFNNTPTCLYAQLPCFQAMWSGGPLQRRGIACVLGGLEIGLGLSTSGRRGGME